MLKPVSRPKTLPATLILNKTILMTINNPKLEPLSRLKIILLFNKKKYIKLYYNYVQHIQRCSSIDAYIFAN